MTTAHVSTSQMTSEALMDRYVAGDQDAFNELHARHAGKLLGYLIRLARSRDRAEDLLQTTLAKMHGARASYTSGSPLMPWLFTIARRSFFDDQRRRRARPESLSRDGQLPEILDEARASFEPLPKLLTDALAELPEGHREALVLTKVWGYSGDEAASELGTTRAAIKIRVHRANRQLREALAIAA